MATFAVLINDVVENIIVADTIDDLTRIGLVGVEYTEDNPAYIGGTYDKTTGKFYPPVVQE